MEGLVLVAQLLDHFLAELGSLSELLLDVLVDANVTHKRLNLNLLLFIACK